MKIKIIIQAIFAAIKYKAAIAAIIFAAAVFPLFAVCQHAARDTNLVYFIDSVRVTGDDESTVLLPEEIADIHRVTDEKEIKALGCAPHDSIIFIITKDYIARPDSVRQIPTIKRMLGKGGKNYLDTLQKPYTGPFINYYPNGKKLSSGNFVDGWIEGYVTLFYMNGNIMESRHFEHNMEDGIREEYHLNGEVKRRGNVTEDKPNGMWQEWYSTGRFKRAYYYKFITTELPDADVELYDYINEGVYYLKEKQYADAVKSLNKAAKLKVEIDDIYYYRGLANFNLKRYKESMADFDKALAIEPLNMEALLARAYSRIQLYQNPAIVAKPGEMVSKEELRALICSDLQEVLKLGDRDPERNSLRRQYCPPAVAPK